jgi:hypothetical protein
MDASQSRGRIVAPTACVDYLFYQDKSGKDFQQPLTTTDFLGKRSFKMPVLTS